MTIFSSLNQPELSAKELDNARDIIKFFSQSKNAEETQKTIVFLDELREGMELPTAIVNNLLLQFATTGKKPPSYFENILKSVQFLELYNLHTPENLKTVLSDLKNALPMAMAIQCLDIYNCNTPENRELISSGNNQKQIEVLTEICVQFKNDPGLYTKARDKFLANRDDIASTQKFLNKNSKDSKDTKKIAKEKLKIIIANTPSASPVDDNKKITQTMSFWKKIPQFSSKDKERISTAQHAADLKEITGNSNIFSPIKKR